MNHQTSAEATYLTYTETEPIDNKKIWACYQSLRESVVTLPLEQQHTILERAAALVNAHEEAAFLAAAGSETLYQ